MSIQTPEFQTPTSHKRKIPSPIEIASAIRAGKVELTDSLLDQLSPDHQKEVLAAWLQKLTEEAGSPTEALHVLQKISEREYDNVFPRQLQFSSVERRHRRLPSPSSEFESTSMTDSRLLATREIEEDSPLRSSSSSSPATSSSSTETDASFVSDADSSISVAAEELFVSRQLQQLSTPIKSEDRQSTMVRLQSQKVTNILFALNCDVSDKTGD
jgi:hypothetical protein